MLTDGIVKDLEVEKVGSTLHFCTTWGKDAFLARLTKPSTDSKALKSTQLPLMTVYLESTLRDEIRTVLSKLQPAQLEDLLKNKDPRIQENVEQILWNTNSVGAFLNKSPTVLNALITWKTLFLPFIAVVMPLVALVVPYVILQFTPMAVSIEVYLERMRAVLLQQITIPVILKSRSDSDIVGFLLERLFIGITLVTFISSIWNQITPAIHLRHIWFSLEEQGNACIESLKGLQEVKQLLMKLSDKKQKAVKGLLHSIDDILEHVGYLEGNGGVVTYAHFLHDTTYLQKIVDFYATIDVLVTIGSLKGICFPNYKKEVCFDISGATHPLIDSCVSNNFNSSSAIITGPNRGGKSTFCKSLGLAVLTAQSWGFAWAQQFTMSPFSQLSIALTPAPALGETSTFEAEIEFAKSVLALDDGPAFVMMDEIFHSTNAYDGIKASRIFLSQLYKKKGVISIISTHYHELATEFESQASQLCMDAKLNDACKLSYSYKVCKGISKLSSVLEILEERGLLVSGAGAV